MVNKKILIVKGFAMYNIYRNHDYDIAYNSNYNIYQNIYQNSNSDITYNKIVLPNKFVDEFTGIRATDYLFGVDTDVFYNMNMERRLIGIYSGEHLMVSEDENIAFVVQKIDKYQMANILNQIKYIRFDHKIDNYNGLGLYVQAVACGVNCIAGFPVYASIKSVANKYEYKSYIDKMVRSLTTRLKMCIIYDNVPGFMDGFFRAISLLEDTFDIYMINTRDATHSFDGLLGCDIVMLKTGFNSDMCRDVHTYYKTNPRPKLLGIFISSVDLIPEYLVGFFNIYFYETRWYKNYAMLEDHNSFHAFGTDTITFAPLAKDRVKDIDYLMVGSIVYWKRPLGLLSKTGKRVAIGTGDHAGYDIKLAKEGVEVINWMEPDKLIEYYGRAKVCYINATWYGGGERCVLDCRAMGVDLELPNDNPKLMELYNSPLYDQIYYAEQIKHGINKMLII
jgi:hypothetical protein